MKFEISVLKLILAVIVVLTSAPNFTTNAQTKKSVRPAASVESIETPHKSNPREPLKQVADSASDANKSDDATKANDVEYEAAVKQANYVYEFVQPQFTVSKFRVAHDANGKGSVTFERRNSEEPYTETFNLSPAAITRINQLLTKLDFINSSETYQAEKDFSHLGNSTFELQQDGRTRVAKYNYTKNADAAELVAEYRRVMEQVLFVFDINLARANQPLEAPGVMKRLEFLVARNGISDLVQLAPLLRELSTDERIPLIARNKAEKLLKKIEK